MAEAEQAVAQTVEARKALGEKILKDLENRFTYHAPKGDQQDRYVQVRSKMLEVAKLVMELTPPSREQSVVLTKLDEAMFFANAAIARNE